MLTNLCHTYGSLFPLDELLVNLRTSYNMQNKHGEPHFNVLNMCLLAWKALRLS